MTERNYNDLSITVKKQHSCGIVPETLRNGLEIAKDVAKTVLRNKVLLIMMTSSALGSGCAVVQSGSELGRDVGSSASTIGGAIGNDELRDFGRELKSKSIRANTVVREINSWNPNIGITERKIENLEGNDFLNIPHINISTRDKAEKEKIRNYNKSANNLERAYKDVLKIIRKDLQLELTKLNASRSSQVQDKKRAQVRNAAPLNKKLTDFYKALGLYYVAALKLDPSLAEIVKMDDYSRLNVLKARGVKGSDVSFEMDKIIKNIVKKPER